MGRNREQRTCGSGECKDPVFLDGHRELVKGSDHLTSVGVLEENGELLLGYTLTRKSRLAPENWEDSFQVYRPGPLWVPID